MRFIKKRAMKCVCVCVYIYHLNCTFFTKWNLIHNIQNDKKFPNMENNHMVAYIHNGSNWSIIDEFHPQEHPENIYFLSCLRKQLEWLWAQACFVAPETSQRKNIVKICFPQ